MRGLHVDVVGGGPGGLFLARLLRLADPGGTVRVYERDGPDDTFGFGVVFSDRAMAAIEAADPETGALIRRAGVSWSDMELRLPGATLRYGGYGFTAISRTGLLRILRRQAVRVGAEVHCHSARELADLTAGLAGDADGVAGAGGRRVTVLADGARSANRDRFAAVFGTTVEMGAARYIWLGTEAGFDAVTFPFVPTEHGVFAAHAYPYGPGMSSFIVETDEATWRRAGLDAPAAADGTDHRSCELLAEVFAEHLGGRPLIGNRSRWHAFRVVRNARWWAGNTVLLGDAAHTAHFSIGSGTKLAMEDALALAEALASADRPAEAFAAYQAARGPAVARAQALAARSMRWWEGYGRRMHLPPHRFGLHFITRTGAIGFAGLTRRHGDRIAEAEAEFAALATGPDEARAAGGLDKARTADGPDEARTAGGRTGAASALGLPVTLGPLRLPGRIAVRLPAAPGPGDLDAVRQAGAALVLADWRGTRPGRYGGIANGAGNGDTARPTGPTGLAGIAGIAGLGAVAGVVVDPGAAPAGLARAVRACGARLIEVLTEGRCLPEPEPLAALLATVDGHAAVCAGLRCPAADPWSAPAERLLARCRELHRLGVAGLHLHAVPETPWEHLLTWADRIRTETRLPVLLDGPDGWAEHRPGTGDGSGSAGDGNGAAGDDWATRLHLAVVSGRLDVVVAWPRRALRSAPRPQRPVSTRCSSSANSSG